MGWFKAATLGVTLMAATARGQSNVFVHTAFGGFILGYDVDRTGTEGFLCEALALADGRQDVAVETFDQRTGNIVRVVRRLQDTNSDFVGLGVTGSHAGLVEFEHASSQYVDGRSYFVLDPLSANRFTGRWTPPLTVSDILLSTSESQGSPVTAFLGFHNGGNNDLFLLSSNVAANTFGPRLAVSDPFFSFSDGPVMALDTATNQAVLAASIGCPNCGCRLALVDLSTGSLNSFAGVGFGDVNGIAVDPATQVACTTTEIDFSVEFYDLVNQTGFAVTLPGATSQAQSGRAVALDPVHRLFLVGQEFSSTAPSGSSIQVYDEQGGFVESINGLSLPASPVRIAIHPRSRRGFVLVTPSLTSLQSFSY